MRYLIPLEDFFEAYFECRRHKRNTVNASAFELNYITNLVNLWRSVNNLKYEIGRSICFIVKYPKLREVFAADFVDRIIHHLVIGRLEPLFEKIFIEDSYSCRKGKGTLYGVLRLHEKIKTKSKNYTKECWVGKFDIKSFFMSINKNILKEKVIKFIDENYHNDDKEIISWLAEKIISNKPQYNCIRKGNKSLWKKLPKEKSLFTCGDDYGLPIGNLTSQIFANFYLHEFDIMMDKITGGFYGRYVDDFYIVADSKKDILDKIDFMKKFLYENLGLTLHNDKLYIQHYTKGVKFIGSVVKKDRIYISNSTISNMYKKIHKFNNKANKETHLLEFVESMNSYLGILKHSNSYNVKYKLLSMIDSEWKKYVYVNEHINKFCIKKKFYKEIKTI